MPEYEIVQNHPSVVMFTAPNPGPKTLTGTHTYIVGSEDAWIIDPGPILPEYQDRLAAWIVETGREPRGVLLTHHHPDHAPGAEALAERLAISVWGFASHSRADGSRSDELPLHAGQELAVADDVLQVVPTPGHSPDHVAFWMPGSRVLFSGDTVLGSGSSLIAPPEGNMVLYLETLAQLARLAPRIIAPGHGPLILEPARKLEEYTRHRREREDQIISALQEGPLDVPGIVSAVYSDIDPRLHSLAGGSVAAQLEKLLGEGRVECKGGKYYLRLDAAYRQEEA